jgi:hypothetical protein
MVSVAQLDSTRNWRKSIAEGPSQSLLIVDMILALAIFMYMLHYIQRLESIGCKCSLTWQRKVIKAYMIFVVITHSIVLVWASVGFDSYVDFLTSNPGLAATAAALLFALNLTGIIFIIQYINELKRQKCECSASAGRTFMFVYSIAFAAVYAFTAVLALYSIHMFYLVMYKTIKA